MTSLNSDFISNIQMLEEGLQKKLLQEKSEQLVKVHGGVDQKENFPCRIGCVVTKKDLFEKLGELRSDPLFSKLPKDLADDDSHIEELCSLIGPALDLIYRVRPLHQLVEALVQVIVPLQRSASPLGSGSTLEPLRGFVFVGATKLTPANHAVLALSIVHETAHLIVSLVNASDPLIDPTDYDRQIYSAIRGSNRPAILAYHGLGALSFILHFIDELEQTELSSDEQLVLTEQKRLYEPMAQETTRALQSVTLTKCGKGLISALRGK